MRKMKTASELRITEDELEALKKTRCLLSRRMPDGAGFNMTKSYDTHAAGFVDDEVLTECGTVACIGGWMAVSMGMGPSAVDDYVGSKDGGYGDPLFHLFYPSIGMPWYDITPSMAVKVIDRFLETGEVDWSSVDADSLVNLT